MYIDLRPYMNPVPFTIRENSPLTRVFLLFRTMGLRHLVVVDIDNKIQGMITRKNLVHLEEKAAMLNAQSVDDYDFSVNTSFAQDVSAVVDESDTEDY